MKFLSALFALAAIASSAFALSCKSIQLDLSKDTDVARLYRMKCARCHSLITPSEYPASEWPDIIEEFSARSGLTDAEHDALVRWTVKEARR
ncbi:MAG: cytochrome c [Planctomycetes bacterium]|nr:cytochrome c [Planctomycetota bacterium]